MRSIRESVGNKLLAVSGAGTALFAAAAGYGLWGSWETLRGLPDAGAAQAVIVSLGLMAAAFIAAFFAFLTVMRRAIVRPAAILVADLARLAGGDFGTPIRHAGSDEFGKIATSAEKIRVDLGRIVQEVQSSAQHGETLEPRFAAFEGGGGSGRQDPCRRGRPLAPLTAPGRSAPRPPAA